MPINKIDVGVQTSCDDEAARENLVMCTSCKIRKQLEVREEDGSSDLQLVPVDGTDSAEKSRIQVPKVCQVEILYFSSCLVYMLLINLVLLQAVEKILAGL